MIYKKFLITKQIIRNISCELTFQKIVDFPKLSVLYQVRHTVNKIENFSIGYFQKVTFKKNTKNETTYEGGQLTTKSINQCMMKRNI